MHNYTDDNTLSSFSNSISNLISLLEEESNTAIRWLKENKMIANPDKFHSIILTKDRNSNSGLEVKIANKIIKTETNVKLLGITIDSSLNFNSHISSLCSVFVSAQLNAIFRLNSFLSFKAKLALVQSFIFANFNYCPLVWHFSSSKSLLKIERIQKRALRSLLNDNESPYELLLSKSGKTLMNIHRLKILCTEIYKTLQNLNPVYMKDIFQFRSNDRLARSQNIYNLKVPAVNSTRFGTNSLSSLGPKIWNNLPSHLKSAESLEDFKTVIKKWNGNECSCSICKYTSK